MGKTVCASVIVACYKDTEALKLIVDALNQQTVSDFEIILAEDGNSDVVRDFVEGLHQDNVIHTTQEDIGWRKNASMNNAIRAASGKLLIFIDGDCIPHKRFVEGYCALQQEKTVLCGRRVELGPEISKQIREGKMLLDTIQDHYLANYFTLAKDDVRHYEEGIVLNDFLFRWRHGKKKTVTILGCNFAVNREDMVAINGFNEDYISPSVGEDTDPEWRLSEYGCTMATARNRAVVFHLYHEHKYDAEQNAKSRKVFDRVKKNREIECKNGLVKLNG